MIAKNTTLRRIFSWFSIVGLCISIIGAIEPAIQLANIVRYVLNHWHDLTGTIWNFALQVFLVRANPGVVALLNATIFSLALQISALRDPDYVESDKALALFIFNRVIIACTVTALMTAALAQSGMTWQDLPKIGNLSERASWLSLGAWVFFLISIQATPYENPYLLARRLLYVAILFLTILAFNYVAIFGPAVRDWVASF